MPSHDSFILLETVKDVINSYREDVENNNVVLELGSGSGYVSIQLIEMKKPYPPYIVMVELDPSAAYSSWVTAKANGDDIFVDVVQCDSATCFRSKFVSLIYFNPPYLPVCDDYPNALVWNGGANGLDVWLSFFSESLRICNKNCVIVFIFSSLQDLKEMFRVLSSCRYIEIFQCQSFFFETICSMVVKC